MHLENHKLNAIASASGGAALWAGCGPCAKWRGKVYLAGLGLEVVAPADEGDADDYDVAYDAEGYGDFAEEHKAK